jgi:hypothetical protein
LRTLLGITGLWNYDLRRTLATVMSNELGYDDATIRAILNHHDTTALGHYRFKSFDSLTAPMQRYADWLWGLKEASKDKRHVVPVKPIVAPQTAPIPLIAPAVVSPTIPASMPMAYHSRLIEREEWPG